MSTTLRRFAALTAVLVGGGLGGLAVVSPAAAHDGEGAFTVDSAEPADGTAVHYVVRLTWTNDGHLALDATVTATAVAPDGTPSTPVPLTAVDQDGRYEATVEFPGAGDWTVRFTAVTPPSTLEQPQVVTVATTSTTAAPSTTAPSTTEAPGPADDSEEAAATDAGDSDDDGAPVVPIAIGALAAVAAGVVAVRRRRQA